MPMARTSWRISNFDRILLSWRIYELEPWSWSLSFSFEGGLEQRLELTPKAAVQPCNPTTLATRNWSTKEMYTNSECSGARITGESVNSNPALLSQASNGLDGSNCEMELLPWIRVINKS